jgi:hypothetical protein
VEASLPNGPDRSHLADAIQFMDLIHLADDALPAAQAAVERSKAAAVTAASAHIRPFSCEPTLDKKLEVVRRAGPVRPGE